MDMQQFWALIEDSRRQVPDPADGEQVAARATALLSVYPREEIVTAGPAMHGHRHSLPGRSCGS